MVIYKIISPLYVANGKQKKCFGILFCGVLANVGLNFIMIPSLGKMGAAISTVLSYSICGGILLFDFVRTYTLNLMDCLVMKKNDVIKFVNILRKRDVENEK